MLSSRWILIRLVHDHDDRNDDVAVERVKTDVISYPFGVIPLVLLRELVIEDKRPNQKAKNDTKRNANQRGAKGQCNEHEDDAQNNEQ